MALPDVQRKQIEDKVGSFCERRVPEGYRDMVVVDYSIRGNSVTIFELRPSMARQGDWVNIPVAQLRFDGDNFTWTLYCSDRNGRWDKYFDTQAEKILDPLLKEVDEDPTGVFWG